jgi:hypothetical protein
VNNVIQIVPTFPPAVSGVGDYALLLATELRREFDIQTQFIVGNPDWQGANEVNGFAVSKLAERTAKSLQQLLHQRANDKTPVLLHYAGYGYQKRGCPYWLVKGLETWRQPSDGRRLVTMFHELYACGSPWTSSFWLSPLQKKLVARLARLSDKCLTSLKQYADEMIEIEPASQTRLLNLPVFSTFGEPQTVKPLCERRRRLVVIGHHGRRALMYERSFGQLNSICERLEIEEMLDVGEPVGFEIANRVKVPLKICGVLPASEISKLLQDSIVGIFDYPAGMLGKSTVFAAYASHKLIPIVVAYNDAKPADGLELEKHYWLSDIEPQKITLAAGQTLADNACDWYQTHNLFAQAKSFQACLYDNK